MLAISVLLGVTCPFILEFASRRSGTKRAMCQQLVEQYMTEISSLYSFGKVILLTNRSQFVMSSVPKRLSCVILYTFALLRVKLYA
jgi:archaellum biogenesis ATPase FlaH